MMPGPDPDPDRDLCQLCGRPLDPQWVEYLTQQKKPAMYCSFCTPREQDEGGNNDDRQLTLDWARSHARDGDPATSIAAAESMQSLASRNCLIVLRTMREAGMPLSAEEVADRCELGDAQVWKRMSDLKKSGQIVKAGTQARNRSKRMADRFKPAGGRG